jgi:sugar O-acyltransferase (sialic acid O-acetyltransferase NeuD family)
MRTNTWTIFGAGELIYDIIDAVASRGQRVEYIVLNMDINRSLLERIPEEIKIIRLDEFYPSTDYYFFGFVDPNKRPLLAGLKQYNLKYANLIHGHSYVPENVKMGEGNYVGAGVVVATYVELGNFNFVNRAASIGHDTKILDFNEIGPGCTIAGRCNIGNRNRLYSGCVVINNVRMGDEITVGAGGVVLKDILEAGTYVGVPARKTT